MTFHVRELIRITCASIVCLFLVGCGHDGPSVVPVSGTVTLDGKPLADVSLSFVPRSPSESSLTAGPGSLGKTDAEGRFRLSTVDGRDGAVVGNHIVRLVPATIDGSNPDTPGISATGELPINAGDGTIRFLVPDAGTTQANFSLNAKE